MSNYSSQRVGGEEEGEGGTIADGADAGSDIGDAASSGLDLPPDLNAVFAIAIIIAVITALQFIRSLARFKHLFSDSDRTLSRNIGVLFPVLLVSYTGTYIASNVIRATYVSRYDNIFFSVFTLGIGMEFTSQFSDILLYGIFLAIIAHRQKVELNRHEYVFNLKTLIDGLLLTTMLVLGVAEDIIAGTRNPFEDVITIVDISLAFEVVGLLASIDVVISAFIARARLSNANKHDKIINTTSSVVGPMLLIGGIYRVIEAGFEVTISPGIDYDGLLVATVVIEGVISVLAVACALSMSAPAANTEAKHDYTIGEKA